MEELFVVAVAEVDDSVAAGELPSVSDDDELSPAEGGESGSEFSEAENNGITRRRSKAALISILESYPTLQEFY